MARQLTRTREQLDQQGKTTGRGEAGCEALEHLSGNTGEVQERREPHGGAAQEQ